MNSYKVRQQSHSELLLTYYNSQRLEITLFSTLTSQTGLLKSNYKLNMRVLLHLLKCVDAGNE